jgi:hypothetical protein
MFGFRADGRRVSQEDAILAFAPYLMPQRVDAQVHSVQHVDCDILTEYIRAQRDKGLNLSYMDLVVAGYVRTLSQHPEMNRFIHNKQLYARNSICVSMVVLKQYGDDSERITESTIKVHFDPTDTIYEVHEKMAAAIAENRKPESANGTDKVARFFLALPGLPTTMVGLIRLLDRYGLVPRALLDVSPFHTGMFVVNMMSLGMPHVNHHIYNFGNTSLFLAMGKVEREPMQAKDGTVRYRRRVPCGVVNDERITSGAEFARSFSYWRELLSKPHLLEVPPESVKLDFPPEKMPGARRKRKLRRKQGSISA